jgi:hypothetical protein
MKNNTPNVTLQLKGRKRFKSYVTFTKKDTIIKNLEIIVASAVAFIVGFGLYNTFN